LSQPKPTNISRQILHSNSCFLARECICI